MIIIIIIVCEARKTAVRSGGGGCAGARVWKSRGNRRVKKKS